MEKRKKMTELESFLWQNKTGRFALYGLSTETERFLRDHGDNLQIVGLLDGFKESGELYGYPVISLQTALEQGICAILVIARPGSCKAIVKRIGAFCQENGILLRDVRGKDLLAAKASSYHFRSLDGGTKAELQKKIDKVEVVSFDLFDTLVMRKTCSDTDVFGHMDKRLANRNMEIPGFTDLRIRAEKECSRRMVPRLEEIYEYLLEGIDGYPLAAGELAQMEWELDRSLLLPRESVCDFWREAVRKGKYVVITTDSYYCKDQIKQILSDFDIEGYDKLLVSCEKGRTKSMGLLEELLPLDASAAGKVLHIGDNETADVESAKRLGMDTYRVWSAADLFSASVEAGMEEHINGFADVVKTGLFVSEMFKDPFVLEEKECLLSVETAFEIGYLFYAPMITDFIFWMKDQIREEGMKQILFCARDGYLADKLYRLLDEKTKTCYFLTSRTAAIRAGMESKEDIAYVDSMKYSGSPEDSLRVRFGIEMSQLREPADRIPAILNRSEQLRRNYKKYMEKQQIGNCETAIFDFVAKGTTQLFLQKLFSQHIKGFYFLQLEPEFMADKNLDIKPFYSDEEKNESAIYELYYILETIMTSPSPTVVEFDKDGEPVYTKEVRSEREIACVGRIQEGIIAYFKDYMRLCPEKAHHSGKKLDEKILSLISRVKIKDEDFLSLCVEDAFFDRMTAVTDLLG